MTIGKRLREWRNQNKLTTKEVIKTTNISAGALSYYENDKREISSNFLLKIKEIYNADIYYILTGMRIEEEKLNENEKELLKIFKEFNERDQIKLLGIFEKECREYKKEKDEKLNEGQGKSSTSKVG